MFVATIFGFFLLNVCLSAPSNEQLLSVQVVYRHGDRTPYESYPTDPYKDTIFGDLGIGQLTTNGMRRQYALGQWLRKRYDEFLPKKYSVEDIRIVSNEIDRTLQSAYTNLAGLYPPEGDQIWNDKIAWQPIPVHTNPTLFNSMETNCSLLGELIEQQKQTVYIKTLNSVSKDVLAYMSQHSGEIYNNIFDTVYLYDTLYIESVLNLTLPQWTAKVFPFPLENFYAIWFSLYTSTKELATLSSGPLFQEITDHFDTVSQKFQMYSGHDATVANVIGVLDPSYPKFAPEFATTVLLELWNINNAKYVKTYLKRNEQIELINVEGCGTVCSYDMFRKKLKEVSITAEQKKILCA